MEVKQRISERILWIKSIATWSEILSPPLRADTKPHSVWYGLKKGNVKIHDEYDSSSYCGIEIKIRPPIGTKINLASVVKPLLDGVISAFHSHGSSNITEVTKRLANKMGKDRTALEKILLDPKMAVFGERNLVYLRQKGIQWNPADDAVVVVRVCAENSNESDIWSHSGEIYTVSEICTRTK